MKVLAIDHGRKRVGVAISDPNRVHAFPLEVVPGQDRHKLLARLQQLIEEHGVDLVVVGNPLSMSGEVGVQALKVREFAERLEYRLGDAVSVVLWDERLSSAQADRGRGDSSARKSKDGTRDMMAAVVILQSYLDRKP